MLSNHMMKPTSLASKADMCSAMVRTRAMSRLDHFSMLEELPEESAQGRHLNAVDEENRPDQCPMCTIDQGFTNTIGACIRTWQDGHTQAVYHSDQHKTDYSPMWEQ
jgi:hypothetical protein